MGEIQGETTTTTMWDKKQDSKEEEEEEEESQARVEVWKYVFGFVEPAVVKCAIELGIADAIQNHGGSITLTELSSTLRCDPSLLNRIMRFLIHRKIFKAIPCISNTNDSSVFSYAHTPLSRYLMKDGPQSMAAFLLLEASPVMLAPWHNLSARVLLSDGNSSFVKAHGEDVWRYAAENSDHSNLINEAMACHARLSVPVIIEDCREVFDGITSLVDVGGGNGTAISIVVKACPWIRGINFDLPHVVEVAPKCDGVEHVSGDMFLSVPNADAAFLMWVLHDWGDEESIQILKKCREAIPKENGRVIIVEAVIEGENKQNSRFKDLGLMLDMVMMAHTNLGKERTLKEWDYVIKMAGFKTYDVKAINNAVQNVIIAFP